MMGKLVVVLGMPLGLLLGCSSFGDDHEYDWGDDDCASADDDDHVGDDDDVVGDDDDVVGDDDDAAGSPMIRVDPLQIMMQVEVLNQADANLRIFNDGDAELIVVGITQVLGPFGIDASTFSGAIAPGDYEEIAPMVAADCHTTGILQDTLQIEHNDVPNNPTTVNVVVDCFEKAK